eukprot:TRINITY_DN18177_c0_g1_i2.p1 TRINITY_DN18177_c0_g1~~TRINITY_DN18177_c0_g1_i2.p1  ORF type:complete len:1216 (+),score=396.49 TRINITY_DN18177_c0_g1_i2:107-3649(+)
MEYYEHAHVRQDFRILPAPPADGGRDARGRPPRARASGRRQSSRAASVLGDVAAVLGYGGGKPGRRASRGKALPAGGSPGKPAAARAAAPPGGKRRQELQTNPQTASKEANKAVRLFKTLEGQAGSVTEAQVATYLHSLRNAVRFACTTSPPQLDSVRDVVGWTEAALRPEGFLAGAYAAPDGDGCKASTGLYFSIAAVLHRHAGAWDAALAACQRALDAFSSLAVPVPTDVCSACVNLATVRSKIGDYAAAVAYSQQAADAVRGVDGGEAMLAAASYNLAVNLQHLGRDAAARAACVEAHRVASAYLHPSDPTALAISDLYCNAAASAPVSVVSCRGVAAAVDGAAPSAEAARVPEPALPPAPPQEQPERLLLAFDDDGAAPPAAGEAASGFGGWGTTDGASFLPPLGAKSAAAALPPAAPPTAEPATKAAAAAATGARKKKHPAPVGSARATKKEKAAVREREGAAVPSNVYLKQARGAGRAGAVPKPPPPREDPPQVVFSRTLPPQPPPRDPAAHDRPKTRDAAAALPPAPRPPLGHSPAWGDGGASPLYHPTPPSLPRARGEDAASVAAGSEGWGSVGGSSRAGTPRLGEKQRPLASLGCRNVAMSLGSYPGPFKKSQKCLAHLAALAGASQQRRQKAAVRIQCAVRCCFARIELYNRRQLLYQLVHERQALVVNLLLGEIKSRAAKKAVDVQRDKVDAAIDARVARERIEDAAAVRLQQAWRRLEERRASRAQAERLQAALRQMRARRLNLTSSLIQKWWRWVLPRKQHWRQRTVEVAEEMAMEEARRRRASAATKLQAWTRGRLAKAEVEGLKERKRRAHERWVRDVPVATDIVRYVLRTVAIRARKAAAAAAVVPPTRYELEEREIQAATLRLQRVGRGWTGRLDADVLAARRARHAQELAAVRVLQRTARWRAAVREVKVQRIRRRCLDDNYHDEEGCAEDAAIRIQKVWRGYSARLAGYHTRCLRGRAVIRAVWCLQGFRRIILAKRARAALAQRRRDAVSQKQRCDEAAARRIQQQWRGCQAGRLRAAAAAEHRAIRNVAAQAAQEMLVQYDVNQDLQRIGRGFAARRSTATLRVQLFGRAEVIQRAWRCAQARTARAALRRAREEHIEAWRVREELAEDLFEDHLADLAQVERQERVLLLDDEHAAYSRLARRCEDFDDASSSSSGCYD